MARKIRDTRLDTREARHRLTVRGKPYWRAIEEGLHVGYRRLKGRAGTWWVRHYIGNQEYTVEGIGAADDLSDADGVAILSFWQAQDAARKRMVTRAHVAASKSGPLTVAQVVEDYLTFLDGNRKSGRDARNRYNAFIKPALGAVEVNALTSDQITAWLVALAKKPPRLRTRKGEAQKYRDLGKDGESIRRRKATANRTLTVLKGALNRAWRTKRKLVPSDDEWRAVEPFEDVAAARLRYLSVDEAVRLANAGEASFRKLVQAALESGARYGELAALRVQDFNPEAGTLAVPVSKTGRPRHILLTDDGVKFFARLCAGRAGNSLMLTKADGTPWGKSHQVRPMHDACKRGKITPEINFHGLRHTWASLAVMNGMPLMVVAKNLGHRDTRMCEKHYSHLAPSFVRDEIRRAGPKFGFKPEDRKVTALRG
jgi:integrase